MKHALQIACGSITDWMKDVLCLQQWPSDPIERRKMKAYTLSLGAGTAMRPDTDGKIHIQIEGKGKSGESR